MEASGIHIEENSQYFLPSSSINLKLIEYNRDSELLNYRDIQKLSFHTSNTQVHLLFWRAILWDENKLQERYFLYSNLYLIILFYQYGSCKNFQALTKKLFHNHMYLLYLLFSSQNDVLCDYYFQNMLYNNMKII